MDKHQMIITCDPYQKKISYQRYDEEQEEWCRLGDSSPLTTEPKYSHATMQHNAYEIVDKINREYNTGNVGMTITFEGTEEDFSDLEYIVKRFFEGEGISCERGENRMLSSSDVLQEIDRIFAQLSNTLLGDNTGDVQQCIGRYYAAKSATIPICVTGTYSSGKSAFINALLGAEILPSASDPTTARIYKIYAADNQNTGKIHFSCGGHAVQFVFEDGKYIINGNADLALVKKLQDHLSEYSGRSITDRMYHTLSVINSESRDDAENQLISELIEVEIPNIHGLLDQSEFRFVFYDTPGTGSDSHMEHFETLKNALADQTNGLPIIVTEPNSLDKGTSELFSALQGAEKNLDMTDAMVIVNQADGKSKETIQKLSCSSDSALTNWRVNRLYFTSSIIGLGGKKAFYNCPDDWNDPDYDEIFSDKHRKFTPESKHYTRLYEYDQVAKSSRERYENEKRDLPTDKGFLLYINSGLHFIESEILEFAEKYAAYNKCAQAQKYLTDAIELVEKKLDIKKREQNELREKTVQDFDDEKRMLMEKLEQLITSFRTASEKEYPQYMSKIVGTALSEIGNTLPQLIHTEWERASKSSGRQRIQEFMTKMEVRYEDYAVQEKAQLEAASTEYWNQKAAELKSLCCQYIKGAPGLTAQEQEKLSAAVMDCPLTVKETYRLDIKKGELSKRFLGLIQIDRVNESRAAATYGGEFEELITKLNNSVLEGHSSAMRDYAPKLQQILENELIAMNPKLAELAARQRRIEQDIQYLTMQEAGLRNGGDRIADLFAFHNTVGEATVDGHL